MAVEAIAEAVHSVGKVLTAAVFPTPAIARALVRQDWASWPVDAVFPMIYQGFYNKPVPWVAEATSEGVRALAGRKPLYCGLYLPSLSPDQLAQAVGHARRAGAAGICTFEARGLTPGHLAALERVMS